MALKVLNGHVAWKRFTTNHIETFVGKPGEPVVDMRGDRPAIRLCDGITPGGHPIGVLPTITGVTRPLIVAPIHGASNIAVRPMITASTFNGVNADGSAATHAASTWTISTNETFSQVVYASGEVTDSLTILDLDVRGVTLTPYTTHFVRVSYKAASGVWSDWSAPISFTTGG